MTLRRSIFFVFIVVLGLAVALGTLSAIAHMMKEQNTDYKLVSVWGSEGDKPGEFSYPAGVKTYEGEVYIVDTDNHRIQVFDLDGKYKRQFGEHGDEPGKFNRPWNILFAEGELYVAGYGNPRIDIYDPSGNYKRSIGQLGSKPGEFEGPISLTKDANNNLIVVDFYNQRIARLTSEGKYTAQWGTTGSIGMGAGEFNYPMDVATSPDGKVIYVADSYNDRVQVFGADGTFRYKWGGPFASNLLISIYHWFPFNSWFSVASAIAVDKSGKIFVGDWNNKRVQVFSGDGIFLSAFGDEGDRAFAGISGISVADDGSVFVVDQGNDNVQKWQPK